MLNRASVTTSLLSSINTKESDILNTLKSLDINKAHKYNDVSISMLKISHKLILKYLKTLFESCLQPGLSRD